MQTELTAESGKSQRTREVYEHQIENIILPVWGAYRLSQVKPIEIERWLRDMKLAPGSKAKTKCVFSILYQHAMRYEWTTTNPARLARQGAMPVVEHEVLTPVEVAALLSELRDPFSAIVYAAYVTGLRRGELFGLKVAGCRF